MFLHTKPLNLQVFIPAMPTLANLLEPYKETLPPETLNYLRGCMLIHTRCFDIIPSEASIANWANGGRFSGRPSTWVTIRVMLEYNGYKVEYPNRLGGKLSSKEFHPLYNYPWSFSLEINKQQLDWLGKHGWVITKKE